MIGFKHEIWNSIDVNSLFLRVGLLLEIFFNFIETKFKLLNLSTPKLHFAIPYKVTFINKNIYTLSISLREADIR